jgi:hypothetical protein
MPLGEGQAHIVAEETREVYLLSLSLVRQGLMFGGEGSPWLWSIGKDLLLDACGLGQV